MTVPPDRLMHEGAARVPPGEAAVPRSVALRLGVAVAAAVAGTLLHDVVEFGRPVSENTGLVAALLIGGAFAWARLPARRRIVRRALIVMVLVFLVGGAIASVLPLPIWPFVPDQGVVHYLVHALWALALGATLVMLLRLRP